MAGDGHHGGAWKVAYADFVTAMMALFIVLWLLNSGESTKAAVAAYFNNPTVFPGAGRGFLSEEGSQQLQDTLKKIRESQEQEAKPDSLTEGQGRGEDREVLLESAKQLEDLLRHSPILSEFQDQVFTELTDEGLRIQLQDDRRHPLFAVGSDELGIGGKELLEAVGQVLKGLPNSIVIEGHTDSRPYPGTNGYSNWELSAERANAARRNLEAAGVDPTRVVEVVGYADRKPLEPDRPFSDRNRRISFLVRFRDTNDLLR
jgi:chemotaxis protein MotB